MGRARPKTKKTKQVVTENTAEPSQAPPIPALLEKAQSLLAQCDYEMASLFVKRILERNPENADAKEMLGVVQLESGELDSARQVRDHHIMQAPLAQDMIPLSQTFLTLIPPNPGAPSPPPSSAYLYLAQLSDDDPLQALEYYQSAVDLMVGQLKGKERAVGPAGVSNDESVLKETIVRALIAMVEIWMDPSYDLWCVLQYPSLRITSSSVSQLRPRCRKEL